MKNIRKYINVCWLIGCEEESGDSGYSVCYCGKHSYYDYDDYNFGLIHIIRFYPKNTLSYIWEKLQDKLYPYIRFCSVCHKVDYWFGEHLFEKHEDCLPF